MNGEQCFGGAPLPVIVVVQTESHRPAKVVVHDPSGLDRRTLLILVADPLVLVVNVGHPGLAIEHLNMRTVNGDYYN